MSSDPWGPEGDLVCHRNSDIEFPLRDFHAPRDPFEESYNEGKRAWKDSLPTYVVEFHGVLYTLPSNVYITDAIGTIIPYPREWVGGVKENMALYMKGRAEKMTNYELSVDLNVHHDFIKRLAEEAGVELLNRKRQRPAKLAVAEALMKEGMIGDDINEIIKKKYGIGISPNDLTKIRKKIAKH